MQGKIQFILKHKNIKTTQQFNTGELNHELYVMGDAEKFEVIGHLQTVIENTF
ncbi:MAG: hypothetical protein UR66_C0016G0019 [Candidatus Moranbacteria bacterium GW2011_GWE1_35_17]|nr:MAG: hypothetical protein UR66_C0016G0019 [Candidatus Moranbacteria bacterium GW2011_GWE1_35_17]KKP69425.1 MAG: hypothetical protein UR65_C0050G0006 [Candidatus Moranbacteria bacterium GW2011_GWE2_35_164]KKP82485.1 MAG: hypothetical protein UR82_C0038G0011 [Candidatus Moranbacteria bacterium GW2011_GWF1_35_5]KKP84321.1 MAG: hypothetical protein UR83_C0023G0011 [Candidatus Moranbacteria bacterium GW2011_GWF2_35_54]